ncbi:MULTISPECIES: hypothetical protein [Ralstonia solanacearum species complex]|uniref:hypothetical protein n=1 Tax=Ralstonia solanacearum species complex TaxID=3116862 RepID=UPI0018D16B32|nr:MULTISPECIES: hypothetical protein [Ralstonia solanacearum species complex]MDN3368262.1 hypothetical protein [Ralstonia pseudosolanacearum]
MTELDLQKYLALSARTLKEEDFPGEAYDLARATRALIAEVRQLRATLEGRGVDKTSGDV